ncbi:hypothetical protein [Prevotella sp. KH2C16]|uniref:hypothetical protein n=1 Tax=Prevotella sp. KH2C16 TaxID=1855325 RepID=UPI0008E65505|nr:hypothetical protein [Prevotella sp. KH2C16]SFG03226.1 hypothetical protein SAMN05216383_10423 [Prevotella sp. KH2C16]
MKKIIESLALSFLVLFLVTACREEEGTTPGGDSTPVATVYQYAAGAGYNPDNDCYLRVATNAAAKETYYLAELKTAKEARQMTDAQYAEYVVQNGKKLDVAASSYKDFYITDLHGLYVVTVVAANGGTRTSQSVDFAGLDYKPYGKGTYTSNSGFFNPASWEVDVEYSEVGNRYRIANNWKKGYGLAFSHDGSKATVYPTTMETGYMHPRYGMVSVSDQGSTYDEATKTFTFVFKFTVSAGSFGNATETLTLK